jgi:2-polyprenyl-6-methoxyphenol hydroxylase-like FAD-dependent oxidoreductase
MPDAGETHAETLSSDTSCDVLVVGFGPVGMTCAALLAQHGLDVAVVERHPARFSLSRAGHLDGETMRTFQRLGIAEAVELVARPMLGWELVTAEREVLASITLGEDGSGWKPDYLSYQPEVEAIIDARARELGVRVFMAMTAGAIEEHRFAVDTVVRRSDDQADPVTISASYVIGCDGAGSFVRDAVGIDRIDLGFKSLDHIVLDFEHRDPDRDIPELPEVYQVLDVKRPQLAGRWNGSRWSRWEFALMEGESHEQVDSEEACWSLLATWGITPDDGWIRRRATYSFESTLADRWRAGRVFVMGDAAHTMPPFMGQGMLSGIRDAVNLSWKLAAVLAGEADDALLDTYGLERAPHVTGIIEMSIALGEMVLITDPELAQRRDDMLRAGGPPRPQLFPRLVDGIVRRPDAPDALEAADGDGRPALQARVAVETRVERLDDQFPVTGWRIVTRHAVPDELFDDRQRTLLDALGMEIVHVSRGTAPYLDIDGEYDLWFRRTGRKAFIERPDHYVFGTARTLQDLPALVDGLAQSLASCGWHGGIWDPVTAAPATKGASV